MIKVVYDIYMMVLVHNDVYNFAWIAIHFIESCPHCGGIIAYAHYKGARFIL